MALENDGGNGGAGDAGGGDGGTVDAGSAADLIGGGDAGGNAGGTGAAGAGDTGGGGAGGGGGGSGSGSDPEFYGQLTSEAGEGQNASNLDVAKSKGWKSLDDVVNSYREAERAVRDGGRVKVPGEGASDEDVAAYRSAIGVPEDASGYTIPEPKDADGNAIPLNTDLTDAVTAAGIKHGVPKAAMDGLLADLIGDQVAAYDEGRAALTKAAGKHVESWGDDKDAKLAQVDAAARDIQLSREDMEYLRGMPSGPGKMLDMLAKYGTHFGEDALVRGDRGSFGMSAEQADKELAAIKADPEIAKKAMVPGSPENKRYERALEAKARAADKAEA